MLNKNVEKAANQLRKETKGKIDILSIIKYASDVVGYRVVFFNTPDGDETIALYNLESATKVASSFTISGVEKIIFVDSKKHYHDRIYLLLHELGHILFGHIGDGNISLKDKPYTEVEADAFVYAVMTPHKHKIASKILILFFAVVLGFCGGFIAEYAAARMSGNDFIDRSIPGISDTNDKVIITRSGESYHREGCVTIKDKDYIFLPRSEAAKLYEPCGVCNP